MPVQRERCRVGSAAIGALGHRHGCLRRAYCPAPSMTPCRRQCRALFCVRPGAPSGPRYAVRPEVACRRDDDRPVQSKVQTGQLRSRRAVSYHKLRRRRIWPATLSASDRCDGPAGGGGKATADFAWARVPPVHVPSCRRQQQRRGAATALIEQHAGSADQDTARRTQASSVSVALANPCRPARLLLGPARRSRCCRRRRRWWRIQPRRSVRRRPPQPGRRAAASRRSAFDARRRSPGRPRPGDVVPR